MMVNLYALCAMCHAVRDLVSDRCHAPPEVFKLVETGGYDGEVHIDRIAIRDYELSVKF